MPRSVNLTFFKVVGQAAGHGGASRPGIGHYRKTANPRAVEHLLYSIGQGGVCGQTGILAVAQVVPGYGLASVESYFFLAVGGGIRIRSLHNLDAGLRKGIEIESRLVEYHPPVGADYARRTCKFEIHVAAQP